jgi:antitoxin component YwqK of YwqJK toxin-antitoxin module
MKNIFYLILLFTGLCSCSQSIVVLNEKQLPEEIFYLPDQIRPYTGKCLIYYSGTNIIKEEMTFKDGILDGPMVSYYKDGSIKRKGEYRNSQFHGKWEYWCIEKKKIYEVNYSNDMLCGEYISWYSSGTLCEKGKYSKNRRTGSWIEYDQAGNVTRKKDYDIN